MTNKISIPPHYPTFRIKPLCYVVCSILAMSSSVAFAEEVGQLDVVDVVASMPDDIENKKVGETVKTAKTIEKQQIQDTRDLVKYETGISVVEKGRMGSSGYAIRGVEENRVNITIDGLQQAETLSSQGFQELFEGYGNFNNTRNGIEVETVKDVNIAKGADSTKVGSGALGGAVIFKTKDARDYLLDKDWYAKVKTGYASRNDEKMTSATLAGKLKSFDALLVRTDRKSHELENYGYDNFPNIPEKGSQGRARQKTDPYKISKESTLLKLSFNPNDNNRFTAMYDDFKNHSKGTDWSYTLAPLQTDRDKPETSSRHTDDSSTRRNMAFSFENYKSNPLWDSAKVTYSQQKISQRAKTDEYCDGVDACKGVKNPLGIQLKDGKIVDKNGESFKFGKVDAYKLGKKTTHKTLTLVDSKGKELPYPDTSSFGMKINQHDLWNNPRGTTEVFLDCSKFDCNSKLRYHHIEREVSSDSQGKDIQKFVDNNKYFDVDLSKSEQSIEREWQGTEFDKNYKPIPVTKRKKVVFFVEDIKRGGKHYKHVTPKETDWVAKGKLFANKDYEGWRADAPNWDNTGKQGYGFSEEYRLMLPTSKGWTTSMWKDRKLNTDIKQLDLDFEKSFDTKSLEHELAYGGSFSKTDKSMINYGGYRSLNQKWWGEMTAIDGIDDNGNPKCDKRYSSFCASKPTASTFLMPVETKKGALYLSDNIRVNDKLSFDLGYRHEKIKHEPHYRQGIDPKLPSGLYEGMFIPQGKKPEYWKDKNPDGSDKYKGSNDPKYLADLKEWKANPQKNIDYLANRDREFKESSYSLAGTFDPMDNLRVQAKYSEGYRIPTSDELYFTFKHPDFSIIPKPDLKTETAKTAELAVTAHKNKSYVTLGAFKTDYDNFIELGFKGYKQFSGIDRNGNETKSGLPYRTYQNINNSKAEVKGVSLDAKLDLADFNKKLKGFNIGYKLAYQKGKTLGIDTNALGEEREIWHAINAINPMKQVASLGYTSPDNKYGIDTYWTHVSAKDKKDTYNPFHGADAGLFGNDEGLYAEHVSDAYDTIDMVGFYKPTKNITVRAGVYNLFDKKYSTWDNIRSIRSFGTSNMICKSQNSTLGCNSENQGIERFSDPGRNFKISLDYKF